MQRLEHKRILFRLLGWTLFLASLLMLLPFFYAAFTLGMGKAQDFFVSTAAGLLAGGIFLALSRGERRPVQVLEGAIYMVAVFPLLAVFGMLPLLLTGTTDSILTAWFEALSALSTTGLSCLELPYASNPPLLLWHSLMSWLGGLIFILTLVTVLPQVSGCFGLTLSARQRVHFSPVWNKMRAAALHGAAIYGLLTGASAISYGLAGLPAFDSVIRALVSLSSGGAGVAGFFGAKSDGVLLAGIFSMTLAGCNILLFWQAFHLRRLSLLTGDAELRLFLGVLLASGAAIALFLFHSGMGGEQSILQGFFAAASFLTTTGFVAVSPGDWPPFVRFLLLLLAFAGGSIGAAGGGLKLVRILVLARLAALEVRRTLHPHMVVSLTIDDVPVSPKIRQRILAFFFLYVFSFAASTLILSLAGTSLMTSMGLAAGALTSAGATAQLFGPIDVATLPAWAKLFLTFLMVLGRIEIFSALILVDQFIRMAKRHW